MRCLVFFSVNQHYGFHCRREDDRSRITPPPPVIPIQYEDEDDYPPPPPPPLNESDLHLTPVSHRTIPVDGVIGQTMIENHEMHANISILSTSRTEDSEDDPKKRNKVLTADNFFFWCKTKIIYISSNINVCGKTKFYLTWYETPCNIYKDKGL